MFHILEIFHKLGLVDLTRTDWRVRVRITRMWPSISKNENLLDFNIILLDSEV